MLAAAQNERRTGKYRDRDRINDKVPETHADRHGRVRR